MKEWGRLGLLAAGLALSAYAYHLWPTHEARAWWQYRFRGVEGVILWLAVWTLLRPPAGLLTWVTALVCAWGAFQSFEVVACSFGGDVAIPAGVGLCTARYGPWPNVILASAGGATLLVWRLYGPFPKLRSGCRSLIVGCATLGRLGSLLVRTTAIRLLQAIGYTDR